MSARACYDCDLRLPLAVVICPVCTARMHYARFATPDEHWEDNVRAMVQAKVDYEQGRPERQVPYLGIGAIRDEAGRWWLYFRDVLAAGWSYPVASFQLFELLDGSIVEVQGTDDPRRRYWVEQVGKGDGGF